MALSIHFYPDGRCNQYQLCSRDLQEPLHIKYTSKQAHSAPIIFELVGQLLPLKPIHPLQVDGPMGPHTHAKFWLKCHPDKASHVFWHVSLLQFHTIAAQCNTYMDLLKVLEVDQDMGWVLICMKWSLVGEQSPFAKVNEVTTTITSNSLIQH